MGGLVQFVFFGMDVVGIHSMRTRHSFPIHACWSQPGHVVISGGLRKTRSLKKRTFEYFGIVFVTSGGGWFEDAT